jgi:hypothetical protein
LGKTIGHVSDSEMETILDGLNEVLGNQNSLEGFESLTQFHILLALTPGKSMQMAGSTQN